MSLGGNGGRFGYDLRGELVRQAVFAYHDEGLDLGVLHGPEDLAHLALGV